MKKRIKRILCMTLSLTMVLSMLTTVYAEDTAAGSTEQAAVTAEEGAVDDPEAAQAADQNAADTAVQTDQSAADTAAQADQSAAVTGTVTQEATADDPEAPVTTTQSTEKPYLSLGADLSEDQRNTVLGLLGVDPAGLDTYDVMYVTNAEEHQYLDSYLDSSEIGSKSWSSVVVYQAEKGSGLNITTKNISYCTQGMYENACATAGITDATIVIAGPTPISGTAALVGIFKAYQEMTGTTIPEDVIDGALNELIVTGDLESAISGISAEDLESLIAFAKQYMAEHNLTDEVSIGEAVDEACQEYNVTLTEDEKSQIVSLLLKLSKLNLDADSLASAISGLQSASSAFSKIGEFFTKLGNSISNFFKNLFG